MNPESTPSRAKVETITHSLPARHSHARWALGGERIPRTFWPPTDDEPLRYEFGAPPFLNFLWISHSIKGRHNGERLFWQRNLTATSIINAILPITSAEPALFGAYADDLFSRWRALRGFRNTLKSRPRVATVAFDGRYMGYAL